MLALLALAAAAACASAPARRPAAVDPPPVEAAARPAEAATAPAPRPFLWRIEGPAGASYLFGTIHAGVRADEAIPPAVWGALADSDGFVMEADLGAATAAAMMERAALPAGQRLDAMLGKKDWARLTALLGAGVPAKALRQLQPWMVYSLVIQLLLPTPEPLDLALQARAVSLGKPASYLEDWAFQVDVLAQTMGIDDLRELVRDDAAARRKLDGLVDAYRAGDLDAVAASALDPEERAAHPDRIRRMFDERNQAWAEALVPRLRRERLFIAVGVGHLVGERGLVALLGARGVAARRVAASAAAPADDPGAPATTSAPVPDPAGP